MWLLWRPGEGVAAPAESVRQLDWCVTVLDAGWGAPASHIAAAYEACGSSRPAAGPAQRAVPPPAPKLQVQAPHCCSSPSLRLRPAWPPRATAKKHKAGGEGRARQSCAPGLRLPCCHLSKRLQRFQSAAAGRAAGRSSLCFTPRASGFGGPPWPSPVSCTARQSHGCGSLRPPTHQAYWTHGGRPPPPAAAGTWSPHPILRSSSRLARFLIALHLPHLPCFAVCCLAATHAAPAEGAKPAAAAQPQLPDLTGLRYAPGRVLVRFNPQQTTGPTAATAAAAATGSISVAEAQAALGSGLKLVRLVGRDASLPLPQAPSAGSPTAASAAAAVAPAKVPADALMLLEITDGSDVLAKVRQLKGNKGRWQPGLAVGVERRGEAQ